MDLPQLYRDTQSRFLALVTDLPATTLAIRVPGTPEWVVQQLAAHVTGVAADMVDGNTEGAATPPWTARQLAQRAGTPLSEVISEWQLRTPEVLEMLSVPGRIDACAFD